LNANLMSASSFAAHCGSYAVARNGGNVECLKIVDDTRALVRPDAPLGVARYVAAEFHRKQDDHSVCVWELPGRAAHRECLQCDAPDCNTSGLNRKTVSGKPDEKNRCMSR
jgi:hypothetical protein